MERNKVIFNNQTLIDLTADTVTESTMLSGTTAHNAAGETITGNVTFQTVYTGSGAPASSLGTNNDIYIRS